MKSGRTEVLVCHNKQKGRWAFSQHTVGYDLARV